MNIDINLPTPRTDARVFDRWSVPADFARELERENAALRDENAALRKVLAVCDAMMSQVSPLIPSGFIGEVFSESVKRARAILAATPNP